MKAIPAFRDPAARLEVLDSLGLDYTLMFPTLATLVEERLKDDPDLILDIVHGLNQWMYETWQFNYEDRIFSTPVINLANVDRALEELEWCLERGAKTVLVRPAPVPGYRGSRSMGLPGVRSVLGRLRQGRHPGVDARLGQRLLRVPQRLGARRRVQAVRADLIPDGRDGQAAHRGHHGRAGLPRRADPQPRSAHPVGRERRVLGAHLFYQFKDVFTKMPQAFPEDPIQAFKRCVYVAPFWEDDFKQMADLCGIDRVIFGSDWPHPEGLSDPINLVDDLEQRPRPRRAYERSWAAT